MNCETSIERRSHMMFLAIIDSDDSATVARLQAILPECTLVAVPLFAEIAGPQARDGATMGGLLQLTRRQQTILPLLLRNLSNKEIARTLSISHFTVRNHVSQLLRVLGCPSRKAAIAMFRPRTGADALNVN